MMVYFFILFIILIYIFIYYLFKSIHASSYYDSDYTTFTLYLRITHPCLSERKADAFTMFSMNEK